MEKDCAGNGLKFIHFIQTWPSDVKKLKGIAPQEFETTNNFDRLKDWVPTSHSAYVATDTESNGAKIDSF